MKYSEAEEALEAIAASRRCPKCGEGVEISLSICKDDDCCGGSDWIECSECNYFVDTYLDPDLLEESIKRIFKLTVAKK